MVAVIVVILLLIAVIGLLRERDTEEAETLIQFINRMEADRKYKDMEADHKERVERIKKQMDETRRHMEDW